MLPGRTGTASRVVVVFVKICGITSVEDALLAAGLGADAVGMIFAPSKRQVTAALARDVVRRLPPEIISVGVFRDERPERVAELANQIGLRVVQLHGRESPTETQWLARRVPGVIKAFSMSDPGLDDVLAYGGVRPMVDGPAPGSGLPVDWHALAERRIDRPYLLAGGLDPDNVAEAIRIVRPWGVDVASGVEAAPGRKDPTKLRHFITNARAAAPDDDGSRSIGFDDQAFDVPSPTIDLDRPPAEEPPPAPARPTSSGDGELYDWSADS